jgi:hypothetical protein
MTNDEDHIFKADKFYKLATFKGSNYTLAKTFDEQYYFNHNSNSYYND